MDGHGSAVEELVATFADMHAARVAIERLEQLGVRASSIELEGAARAAAQRPPTGERDERFMRYALRSMRLGAALGAAVGAVGGLVAGLVLFGVQGGTAATVLGGALMGAGIGFFQGVISRVPQSEAGTATIESGYGGSVDVAVRTDDGEELRAAERILAGLHPQRIRRGRSDEGGPLRP